MICYVNEAIIISSTRTFDLALGNLPRVRSILVLVYDFHVFQFGLSCGDDWLVDLANSLYMVGMFVGSLGLGYISDRSVFHTREEEDAGSFLELGIEL